MKVHIFDYTEGYPVWNVCHEISPDASYDIDDETLKRWKKVSDEFVKMQKEIRDVVNRGKLPFPTEQSQVEKIGPIAEKMTSEGLSEEFVKDTSDIARVDQGMFELMEMWSDASDLAIRSFVVSDIESTLNDYYEHTWVPVELDLDV